MIVRRCAGGVVFYANKVLLLKNDRDEWTLPKGKIHDGELAQESAIQSKRRNRNKRYYITGCRRYYVWILLKK